MHEIPHDLEQTLRAQGFDDAQLDELRRTGRVERGDDHGNSTVIEVEQSADGAGAISFDGQVMTTEIPPEALEKLRRFHRFMPKGTIDQLERATGQDIDGDGRIGHGDDATSAAPVQQTVAVSGSSATPDVPIAMVEGATGARIPTGEHRTSGAMPEQSGPFVQHRAGASLLPWLLVLAAFAGLIAWIATR